jgi:vacuolar-type H+-ATPase catalytic subunit A/Vma1
MENEIDYLFEDPEIQGQKFALISIVGPNMPQKCNVWGIKVRGVAESLEKAKNMSQKIMKFDENYDVYTVEMGKFFPLVVDPNKITDIEYQNSQLNQLVKTYLENKEYANEQWVKRKNDMVQEAIKEGKNQKELASRPEHPVSVLQKIYNFENETMKTKGKLEKLDNDLQKVKQVFETYTEEEREFAKSEINKLIEEEKAKESKRGGVQGVSTTPTTQGMSTIAELEEELQKNVHM